MSVDIFYKGALQTKMATSFTPVQLTLKAIWLLEQMSLQTLF